MIQTGNFEKVEIKSAEELRAWLLEHHRQEESVNGQDASDKDSAIVYPFEERGKVAW